MPERGGGIDTYRCVCGCVVLWLGTFLGLEKNSKKRGVSVSVLVVDGGQAAYAVRQVKRMCDRFLPPLFTLSSW